MNKPPNSADTPAEARRLDGAIVAALVEFGVDASFLRSVRDLVLRQDENWRVCCGTDCQPCVETLGAVVDRVRRALAG